MSNLEERLVAEWGVVRAWIAIHPWATAAIHSPFAILGGWLLGHWHIPI